jgi:TRAP-type C4-dicarboxylate transport system substrate-binding protein
LKIFKFQNPDIFNKLETDVTKLIESAIQEADIEKELSGEDYDDTYLQEIDSSSASIALENTGERVRLNELATEEWIEDAKVMQENGLPLREISDRLSKKGFTVSKSTLQRKLN